MTVVRWPDESPEYARLRDELHTAEVALRDQRERVAALRRALPADTRIPDQTFREVRDGEVVDVRLGELFTRPGLPLIVMHFMYGKAQTHPCPMCTCWADGYDGLIPHIEQRSQRPDGTLAHSYSVCAYLGEAGFRGMDLLNSLWHFFDLLPEGRGDFMPSKRYATP